MDEWRAFAENNNLTYKSEIFLIREPHVSGHYGPYQFRLETFSRSKQVSTSSWGGMAYSSPQTYTRMMLQAPKSTALVSSPKAFDIADIITFLIPTDIQQTIKGRFYAYDRGQKIVYEHAGFVADPPYLQRVIEIQKDLMEKYPGVLAIGGEAISVLHPVSKRYHILQHVAGQLIFDIGQETEKKLKKQQTALLCPRCWVHNGKHQVNVSWIGDVTFYGCRACGQSRDLIEADNHRLVARLDRSSLEEQTNRGMTIQINWIKRPQLFDFETVEIIEAADEEVERFVVQVGNDPDLTRRPGYREMVCKLSAECRLSENTMRLLRRTFGEVVTKPLAELRP